MKYRNKEIQTNQYLYGVPASNYAGIQIRLCRQKIADAKMLMADLRNLNSPTAELISRYQAIEKAIQFNEQLIEEAEGK